MSKKTSFSKKNAALAPLGILIGTWSVKIANASMFPNPNDTVTWQASFEWLEDAFIIEHSEGKGDFPKSISIIGRNENNPKNIFSMFYYDSRGVSRIYDMSFDKNVWKFWREDTDFFQRFEGKISKEGQIVTGNFENSNDNGKTWEHDFSITYTRIK